MPGSHCSILACRTNSTSVPPPTPFSLSLSIAVPSKLLEGRSPDDRPTSTTGDCNASRSDPSNSIDDDLPIESAKKNQRSTKTTNSRTRDLLAPQGPRRPLSLVEQKNHETRTNEEVIKKKIITIINRNDRALLFAVSGSPIAGSASFPMAGGSWMTIARCDPGSSQRHSASSSGSRSWSFVR